MPNLFREMLSFVRFHAGKGILALGVVDPNPVSSAFAKDPLDRQTYLTAVQSIPRKHCVLSRGNVAFHATVRTCRKAIFGWTI